MRFSKNNPLLFPAPRPALPPFVCRCLASIWPEPAPSAPSLTLSPRGVPERLGQMQGLRWGSPWKIPLHPRAASGAGPAASARAVEHSPRPAQAHTDKQSEPRVQPGAAPPARPHGHTIEGTCWGALCWQRAWSGLPTASDTTGGFPGLGLAPMSCGCWEMSCAGWEIEQPLLDQDMGWGCCNPPAPNLNTLSGHLGDVQASPFPKAPQYPPPGPVTVLPAWCPHPCPRGWDPPPRWAADTRALAALTLAEVIQ